MGKIPVALSAALLVCLLSAPQAASAAPSISGIVGNASPATNQVIRLQGAEFLDVKQILVDGVKAKFSISSDTQLALRIPITAKPGDVDVVLVSKDGSKSEVFQIEIAAPEVGLETKVTIGSFLGFVAVYTKNLSGHKLSIEVGNLKREVSTLSSDFTKNLTRVGSGKLVEVRIFVDDQLVKTQMIAVL